MKPLSIQEIRKIVGGRALTAIPGDGPSVTAVCTDTRRMEKSSLFVALRGENHDSHRFLSQAAGAGAIAALVDHEPVETLPNVAMIAVPDTKIALGKLANHVRKQLRSKVIAVAGSNGKTGTKNLIDAALRAKLRGSISPKSFNNDIGVPLTIFPADPLQDYLVLETGTNHHGELAVLTKMAEPDIAVITNISAEHLEGLDDIAGVRREEASVILGLRESGALIVNGDDPDLLDAVSGYRGKIITFGFKPTNDLYATDIQCDQSGVGFNLNGGTHRRVFVPVLGRHSAANTLAAIAVARRLGLTEEQIIEALSTARGPEMRLQLYPLQTLTLLNDAYNANPASMRAALETLLTLPGERSVAVLGEMREMGHSSERFHREMGQFVGPLGLGSLICVGPQARWIAEEAVICGMPADRVGRFDDAESASAAIPTLLRRGDVVLLKGSRGVHLERVQEAIFAALDAASESLRKAAS